jgi:hypothetical protein
MNFEFKEGMKILMDIVPVRRWRIGQKPSTQKFMSTIFP